MTERMNKPRLAYDDLKGQPIDAYLTDGSTLYGTVTDLWLLADGNPAILRVDDRDVPWHAIVWINAQPALSDGWHGPNTLNDAPIGAHTWTDGHGNTWWKNPGT